ncbi:hypothetical protein BGX21_005213 [Mortierella sp. AD011]|nr:hypothetical protein BGX20_005218 [Mortierella sp. AD010]KAF9399975.1 hypothetical protein BGX21_005213 [Mortierella sp. AD011]
MEATIPTSKRHYDSIDVGHELAFIPFAKTSKTFIKKAGNNANSPSVVEYSWTSNSTDDAKVPRSEDEYCDSNTAQKDVEESPVHRQVGGARRNDEVLNVIPSSMFPSSPRTTTLDSRAQIFQLGLPSTSNTAQQSTSADGDPAHVLYRKQADYQEQLEQQQQHVEFAQDRYEFSEIILEMPPPRLSRKLRKPNSLNQKYARMKHDMELISQDAALQLGNSNEPFELAFAGSFSPTFACGASPYYPNLRASRSNGHMGYGATTPYRDSTLQDAYRRAEQHFEQYMPRLGSPSIPSSHNLPISNNGAFESVVPSTGSTASPKSSFRGDSDLYSMPYFRFSSLPSISQNRDNQTLNETYASYPHPYGENGKRISRNGHLDRPTSENILHDHERTDDTVFSPYILAGNNANIIHTNEGQSGPLTDALVPPVTDSKIQNTFDEVEQQYHRQRVICEQQDDIHEQVHEYSHELPDLPSPQYNLFDKIHKIGAEIKASATATVPRFGAGNAATRDMEKEQERRKQRQKSRFEISVKPSTSICTQVQPKLDLLKLSFKTNLPDGKCMDSRPPSTGPENLQTVMDTTGADETSVLITSTADNQSSERQVIVSGQSAPMTASDLNSQQIERNQIMETATMKPMAELDPDLERISMIEQEIQNLAEN